MKKIIIIGSICALVSIVIFVVLTQSSLKKSLRPEVRTIDIQSHPEVQTLDIQSHPVVEDVPKKQQNDLSKVTDSEPTYTIGQVYPICGSYDIIETFGIDKSPSDVKLPFCQHLRGQLDSSDVDYFKIISVDKDWVELERNQAPVGPTMGEVPEPEHLLIKRENFTTPVMFEHMGKLWPLPFLKAEMSNHLVQGILTWCDFDIQPDAPTFLVPDDAKIIHYLEINQDQDCRT